MCRMLGVVFRKKFPEETLSELKILSEAGLIPGEEKPGHRDGWGIVAFEGGRPRYLGRSVKPAFSDRAYDEAIVDVERLSKPNILIAHVRAASSGGVAIENTHPFIVDGLAFAHNGTVKGMKADPRGRAKGKTDSEIIAHLVADRMREKGSLMSAMKSVVREEIDKRTFTGAVMLASDGQVLVGYRDFSIPERAAYYGLKTAESEGSAVSLFQETAVSCKGECSEVGKREMVSVSLELDVIRETL